MSMGLANRMTMDVDVWREGSMFDVGALKRACAAVGVAYDPRGFDEPDSVYIQMIDPGIVQVGVFDETVTILKAGNLEIRRPPVENVVASKMTRGDARDYDDCAFLLRKCNIPLSRVEKAIDSIEDDMARETAMENMQVLKLCVDTAALAKKKVMGRSPSFAGN